MESTISRLRYHAGLEEIAGAGIAPIAEALWQGSPAGDAFSDILVCMEKLNHEMNGPLPSGDVRPKVSHFDRKLLYAIYEIGRQISQAAEKAPPDRSASLCSLGRKFDAAWGAILAGDIDDIRDHIEDEA